QRDGLGGALDRLWKLAELGQTPAEERARVHGLNGGHAPPPQRALERHHVVPEERGAAPVVAHPVQNLPEAEIRGLLEARVGQGCGDGTARLPCLDRTRVIAGEEEPVSPVDGCPSQPGAIADASRLRLGFAQMPQHAAVVEERYARLTQGESEIDRALDGAT